MDLVNISLGNAGVVAVLGYLVVFLGLLMLMVVVMILGRIMIASSRKAAEAAASEVPSAEPVKAEPAPGTAGDLKLYDTDPKDAAMIMAIVADSLGKPLNELRFKSIKEVKE
jgi:Na+-transporting methylmalonyl-CoA/oxaloacetate decarboxylase gamma subunit